MTPPPGYGPAEAARRAALPLSLHGLSVSYASKTVLFSVDFDVPPGVLGVILGPNGAGKSTLLKASLDLIPRLAGDVAVFGASFAAHRQRVAYVPQRASVDWEFPATVFDVVAMGLYPELSPWRGLGRDRRQRIEHCLEQVGMREFAQRQIGKLSGGQQQRVFLARALVQNADLYLLDEPFAGVDAATERTLIRVLRSLQQQGRTVLCVHHDLATVADYFDYALLLNVRRVASGPLADVLTAENLQATYGGRLAESQLEQILRPREPMLDDAALADAP